MFIALHGKNCTIVGHVISKPWILLAIWKGLYNIYLRYHSCVKMEKSMPRKRTQEWDFFFINDKKQQQKN